MTKKIKRQKRKGEGEKRKEKARRDRIIKLICD